MTTKLTITKPTVLVVDDEVNVLKSLKRALFKLDVELLFTDSSQKALQILAQRAISVVVSDMKMPELNGAQLLEKVAQMQPDTYRIVLTGYADIKSLQDAVNFGKTHRILNKPWKNEDLVDAIEEGLERTKLKTENARLQALTKKQNNLLKNSNLTLEKKVTLRTLQIKQALGKIKRHSEALEKVLYNVIVINPDIDGKFARLVSDSAYALANAVGLDANESKQISFAALLCEIGLLGLSPGLYNKTFNNMNFEEYKQYTQQTRHAALILAPVTELETCSNLIVNQFEALQGNLNVVPLGSKIIAICRDYWHYRLGKMTGDKLNDEAALVEMRKHIGKKYEKTLLDKFADFSATTVLQNNEGLIDSDSLQPGMVLKQDLFNSQHILLLPAGHVFTEQSIAKVKQFERGAGNPFALSVVAEEKADTETR